MDVWSFLKGGGSDKVEVGAFGKIPAMGDFVRVGAKPLPSFETFIEQGMAAGEAKHRDHRDRWAAAYAAGQPHGFVFRGPAAAKETNVMVGVVTPSTDAVGRKFPLVVFADLPAKRLEGNAHLMPLASGAFLLAAARLLSRVDQLANAEALREAVAALPVLAPTAEGSSSDYAHWTRSTYARSVWEELYGDPDADVALAVLRSVLEAVGPLQHRGSNLTSLGLRLPLGAGELAPRAAFWIDAVRRATGWRSAVPTCFWSVSPARLPGSLLLQLGVTPPGSLANLWLPDPDSDDVYDLCLHRTTEYRQQLVSQLPRELAASLARWDAPIADVLAALGH